MATQRLGIIMHGVTGRMGYNQHLVRSILSIREQGGVLLANGDKVMPDPIIVGRNGEKIAEIARKHGIARFTTSLDQALANKEDTLFFDAGSTLMRADLLTQAMNAGKMIYCEKPIADSLPDAIKVAKLARSKGIKNGVVQDKLFLPGLRKMKLLKDAGFFGRLLSVRGEFGYWVFEGDLQPIQRPSWNYKKAEGGGIILDMLCHWRYVLDNLFGEVKAISCLGVTHIPVLGVVYNPPTPLRPSRGGGHPSAGHIGLHGSGRGDRHEVLGISRGGGLQEPVRRPPRSADCQAG